MRHWSCESVDGNKNKYRNKIDLISNRMMNLEKDIEQIRLKNISPIPLSKITKYSFKDSEKNDNIKEEKIDYESKNKKNNYNLFFRYSNKDKALSHKNTNYIIRKNNSYSIIPREKLEYEYELRNLKRKLDKLKTKNRQLKENVNLLRETNNKIEFGLNLYKNVADDDIIINKKKDDIILNKINNINYKKYLIHKIIEISKKNNYYYNTYNSFNTYENSNNNEESSLLNMLLNLMDIRYAYENAILYNFFFQGLLIILPNFKKEYTFFDNPKDILKYIIYLIEEDKHLKKANQKFADSKKYYNLFKKFVGIKNLEDFLNKIILKNIRVEQSFNKIKHVLNENKKINDDDLNGMNDINKKQLIEQLLNKNRNNSNYNIDKISFYTNHYYKKKHKNYNPNYFNRNNKSYLVKNRNERKSNSIIHINRDKIINTNYQNYIQSKNIRYMNKNNRKMGSKTVNDKKPKNLNKLFSYSVSKTSKSIF